jgi:hypothetical protein
VSRTPRHTPRGAVVVAALVAMTSLGACTGGDGRDRPATSAATGSAASGGSGASVTVPTPSRTGSTALGAKWDGSRFKEFEPYLTTLRGGSTFYELVWCDVEEKKGTPDWSTADRIAERSEKLGIALMLKLRVGACWATESGPEYERGNLGKTESVMPTDLDAYRAWVRTAVERYSARGVRKFAVENEINSRSFWGGTPDEYRQLVEAASTEIRATDSEAQVVDAGLSSTTYGYGIAQSLLDQGKDDEALAAYKTYYSRRFGTRGDQLPDVGDVTALRSVLRSEQGARNLTYLSQATALAERGVVDVRQVHFYEKYDAVPLFFDYVEDHTPDDVPIEAWEVGRFSRSDGDADAEAEMVKTVTQLLGRGAQVVIWLPLAFNDKGKNADEPRVGLLDPDGTLRPIGVQFAAMADAARGATIVPIRAAGLAGIGMERPGSTTLYLWADDSPRSVTVEAGDAVGPVGAPRKVAADESVTVKAEPQELTTKESVKDFLAAQR